MTIFVNSLTGSINNSGTSVADPTNSLRDAIEKMLLIPGEGLISIFAPESDPIREEVIYQGDRDIEIVATDPGVPWTVYGSVKRIVNRSVTNCGVICVLPVEHGMYPEVQIGGLPAHYGMGWCQVADLCDPGFSASYVEVPKRLYGVRNDSPHVMTLRNGIVRACLVDGILCRGDDSELFAFDCESTHNGVNGFATRLNQKQMILENCLASWNKNDGFNHHNNGSGSGQLMRVVNGIARFNHDEGISPHDSCVMEIIGGEFTNNGSSGFAGVNDSITTISGGAVFDNNGKCAREGGLNVLQNASLEIISASADGNDGRGLACATTGQVTIGGWSSTNNTKPDSNC